MIITRILAAQTLLIYLEKCAIVIGSLFRGVDKTAIMDFKRRLTGSIRL